ncbi:ankyrin repeat-containing domain protein [Mycena epipterygia]|nr:ankyrin repeat-containing domain protein [Mycena epipterygia]
MSGESQTVNNYISGGTGGSGGGGGVQGGSGGAGEGPAVTHHINVAGNFTMNSLYPEQPEGYHNSTERDEIIEWYSPLNFFPRQADIFAARQPGTGGWLLESDLFKNWKSGRGEILWCPGIPGAGKTTLVSIVVDHLRTAQDCENIGVAAIYLNHKESDAHSPSSLLASLWRQLVFGKSISLPVRELHTKHRERRTRPSVEEAHAVLCSIISEYSRVFVLVDALDEYPEMQRHALLRCLVALRPTVDLMLTSRPHIKFDHVIPNTRLAILEIRATKEDIREYLDQQILKSTSLFKHISHSADLRETIEEKIVQSSDGMFLLAKLHINSLAAKLTVKAVRDALRNITSDLEHTYDEIVDRINRQPDEHKKIAWLTLSWITNAKRPLHSSELREALAVEPGAKKLDPENLLDMDTILSVCSGLVVLNDGDDIIRLIHYTTQKYFERDDGSGPALQQAVAEWSGNDVDLNEGSKGEIYDWALWAATLAGHETIVRLLFEHGADVNAEEMDYSILQVASGKGHEAIVKLLIAHGADINNGLPLLIAVERGHEQVVEHLLEHGADVNAEGRNLSGVGHRTALLIASQEGHEVIVELLITHGANVTANGRQGSALWTASQNGHKAVAKLLIAHGADINAVGELGSALWVASEKGHKAIVKLLIAHGANVNADGWRGSALCAASEKGHEAVVKLLIARGADVNAENRWRSALRAASEKGHEAVVKLLISHGADVNAENGWRGSALQVASENGHETIVKLLIKHGADINAKVEGQQSTLQAASEEGNEAIAAHQPGRGDIAPSLVQLQHGALEAVLLQCTRYIQSVWLVWPPDKPDMPVFSGCQLIGFLPDSCKLAKNILGQKFYK